MGNLNKVTYTDHQTVITADNLNAIQDSVIQNTSYTTCSTAAGTAAKTVALTNFVLTTGSAVKVKFTNTNTAANPTLNVNSTGAKPIMQYGVTPAGITPPESWDDGAVVEFVYDGTNWVMQGRNTIDAVSKSGGTFDGDVFIDKQDGTASTEGWSGLTLGNNIPKGTAKNSTGYVRIFGKTGYRTDLNHKNDGEPTSNHSVYLPDATGTVMLDSGGTFRGNVTIDKANGTAGSNNYSVMVLGNTTPMTTAGHSTGIIDLCGFQSYYTEISPANPMTANRYITLPNASGTIALNESTYKYKGALASGADLNNLTGVDNIGTWMIQDSATNAPNVAWCTLYNNVPDYGQQMIVTGSNVFTRTRSGNPRVWGAWFRSESNPITNGGVVPLTVTRVENAFANADSISRVIACKRSGILYCSFNFSVTSGGTTSDFVQVCRINGWNAYASTYINIPGQNVPSQTLLAYINLVGSVYIYSAQQITSQFFRANFVVPSVD